MTRNQIDYAKHVENRRHNLEMERQGQSTIDETSRHNRKSEDIGYGNISLGYGNLAELSRHNQQQEAINWFTAENLGYLQSQQSQYYSSLSDKTASEIGVASRNATTNALNYTVNLRNALEGARHNAASESETVKHNRITERETHRSNYVNEGIRSWSNEIAQDNAVSNKMQAQASQQRADNESATVDTQNIRNLGGILGLLRLWR